MTSRVYVSNDPTLPLVLVCFLKEEAKGEICWFSMPRCVGSLETANFTEVCGKGEEDMSTQGPNSLPRIPFIFLKQPVGTYWKEVCYWKFLLDSELVIYFRLVPYYINQKGWEIMFSCFCFVLFSVLFFFFLLKKDTNLINFSIYVYI